MINFYGQYQNDPRVINYLLISQRNCGTRSIRRNPLVCCSDPSFNRPQQQFPSPQPQPIPSPITEEPTENPVAPTHSSTSSPPPTQPTTHRSTTQISRQTQFPTIPQTTPRTTPFTQIPDQPQSKTDQCHDPNGVEGICKNIKQCPTILNDFVARSKDAAYIRYIKQSNAKCHNMQPFVCCPTETKSIDFDNKHLQGRLLTPEEGCGSPNISVSKIVGGTPAHPGKLKKNNNIRLLLLPAIFIELIQIK